jgi:perosamine synthetase
MINVHRPFIGKEELDAVARVFDSRWLGMGEVTKQFEKKLRDFLGAKHVIAVNTGTSALHLVPSLTFVATVQAILAVRARPVFCDVSADTLNIDVADALGHVTSRTKVMMPVHFAGLACEMDELLPQARERNLRIVEDAAQAFGSSYKGRKVGTLSNITCFSFDAIKNITCGNGGAVVTDNEEIARQVFLKRNVGIDQDSWSRRGDEQNWLYEVVTSGYRYHLTDMNAAIGLEQLKRFDAFKARKQAIVRLYDKAFIGLSGLGLVRHDLEEAFPFSYVVRVFNGRRDALMRYLRGKGIETLIQFTPNHLQPAFAAFRVPLPVTEQLYKEVLSLPLYFEMTDTEVERVINAVRSFIKGGR